MATDGYEAFYADKLWALVPEIYRAEDSVTLDGRGPLREIVERVSAEAAIVRRSIDRLWEDQGIETCDDWVIPYVADLLATNLVPSLDSRAQRLDVAKTIYYRRRKGTVAILEEIAADITGWDARVVEFFRRMTRARHGLDPEIGLPSASRDPVSARLIQEAQGLVGRLTRTPMGGTADLRNAHGASLSRTAFDEYSHVADMRIGRGYTGWHNITHLGVFVWRLQSVPIDQSMPVPYTGGPNPCPDRYTFDPTGREIPLFADSARTYGDAWIPPEEHQVRTPISAHLLRTALTSLYAELDPQDNTIVLDHSVAVYEQSGAFWDLVDVARVTAGVHQPSKDFFIDPEKGRLYAVSASPPAAGTILVGYRYGFSSGIGAGGYDRRVRGQPDPPAPTVPPVSGGGTALSGVLSATGKIEITDSLTYTTVVDVAVTDLTIRAENERRPVVRLTPTGGTWEFTGAAGSVLTLDGLLVSGADILLSGEFDKVTIVTTTLDPGQLADGGGFAPAADGELLVAAHLRIDAVVKEIVIDRSIVGPIVVGSGKVETISITDSIVHAVDPSEKAIDVATGEVRLLRSTILGEVHAHRIDVDTSILHQDATVDDAQHGCVRFSAWADDSVLPRKYESVPIEAGARLFTSRRFGDPGYAQLSAGAPQEIAEGAEDGSEMGAFCREKNAIKKRSILVKYQEYMPVGLAPVVIEVT